MNLTHIEYVLSQRQRIKGIVIDTNLLLVFLIGSFDKSKIGKEARTDKFTESDFIKLYSLIDYIHKDLIITQSILTEVCNFSNRYNEKVQFRFFKHIQSLISNIKEKNYPLIEIIAKAPHNFYKFGLTDAGIIDLAINDNLIITDDLPLYHRLISDNLLAINYNHILLL